MADSDRPGCSTSTLRSPDVAQITLSSFSIRSNINVYIYLLQLMHKFLEPKMLLHLQWIPMFMTVLLVPVNHQHWESTTVISAEKRRKKAPWKKFTIQRINKFPRCGSPNLIIITSKPDYRSPLLVNTYLTAHCQNWRITTGTLPLV